MFDKRFKVYDATRNVFLQITNSSDIDKQKINEFRISTSDAGFLFDDEISKYLEEILKKANLLNHAVSESKAIQASRRLDKLHKKQDDITEWFDTQSEEVKKLFSRYLQFEAWRESGHWWKNIVQNFIKTKKG